MKRKLVLIAAALALAGCETLDQQQEPAQAPVAASKPAATAQAKPATPAAQPAAPELPPARKALNAGIDMYKAGNFNGAIKQLTTAR